MDPCREYLAKGHRTPVQKDSLDAKTISHAEKRFRARPVTNIFALQVRLKGMFFLVVSFLFASRILEIPNDKPATRSYNIGSENN